ncbi:MAG: glycosyltransferase, partial [Desulfobacterales bacterium]|nr:glycosyltransferase [Desulfobacterales bacterium]
MGDQMGEASVRTGDKGVNRVAFYGFRSGRGGISHVMLNLMHGVLDHGTSVDLLLNNTDIPELADLRPGVRVVELGRVDGLRRVPPLVRYLKREAPAALLVNREPANRTVNMARALCKTPTRVTVRVGMAISIALKRRYFIKRWLRQRAIVSCYRRAECIIANAADVAEDIELITGIPLDRIHVINNPTVAPELFQRAGEPVDHPWFAPGAPPGVLGVGRL